MQKAANISVCPRPRDFKKGKKGNLSNEDGNLDLPESLSDSDLDDDSEPAHALASGTLNHSQQTPYK